MTTVACAQSIAQAMPVIGYPSVAGALRQPPHASAKVWRMPVHRGRTVAIGTAGPKASTVGCRATKAGCPALAVIGRRAALSHAGGKSATTKIPIVFEMGADPVKLGVVESRPGRAAPLACEPNAEVSRKRLSPCARCGWTRPACRCHQSGGRLSRSWRAPIAARPRRQLLVLRASMERFQRHARRRPGNRRGGLVFSSIYFAYRSHQLAALAVQHLVPTITQSRDFPLSGGLMSYGGDFSQSHRQTGRHAGRVLKGQMPSDLPVQRVTKLELFINLKTAGALGITFPPSILTSADRVIE